MSTILKSAASKLASRAGDVPEKAAKKAGLQYVSDTQPGISRRRWGKSFRYFDSKGKPIGNPRTLDRIRNLVIPPAWTDVWICKSPTGHLQAVGWDARHRKQYLYHPAWRNLRDQNKYEQMLAFAAMLPAIRRRVRRDLKLPALTREKVLAAVVQLLELTLIRVGNDEYAKTNHSFGLTTLRRRHVAVTKATIRFEFRGKSGIEHEIAVQDSRLAKIVRECQELPGQELFQYVDENNVVHDVGSADVNSYLQEISGEPFTAKDFRTWAGTRLAAQALQAYEAYDSETTAKRNIVQAIKNVAAQLGNTVAVCRKSYIHPAIINAYLEGTLSSLLPSAEKRRHRTSVRLTPEELAIVKMLRRLKKDTQTR